MMTDRADILSIGKEIRPNSWSLLVTVCNKNDLKSTIAGFLEAFLQKERTF